MFPLREKCPNTGKYGLEKTPYLDTFRAVLGAAYFNKDTKKNCWAILLS